MTSRDSDPVLFFRQDRGGIGSRGDGPGGCCGLWQISDSGVDGLTLCSDNAFAHGVFCDRIDGGYDVASSQAAHRGECARERFYEEKVVGRAQSGFHRSARSL